MSQLNTDDIKKLADLSKIELTESESREYLKNINDILAHVSQVTEFKSDATFKFDFDSQVRQDILGENILDFDRQIMLANIPSKSSDNFVKVSKVIKK